MNIYLQAQGFELTPAIDAHVRSKLASKLAFVANDIKAVDVFLADINGPKGGADKKVVVCVQLKSRLSVRLEAVHSNLYGAISVIAGKVRHSVKRTLHRRKRLKKARLRELRQYAGELQAI
ncbi:MAG: putative sigma-54 modulation protein [Halioglobus sp.]|jgi:ribosome-associated translation inhibitor RaiA